jgi:hypothetical protein
MSKVVPFFNRRKNFITGYCVVIGSIFAVFAFLYASGPELTAGTLLATAVGFGIGFTIGYPFAFLIFRRYKRLQPDKFE